jgi:hypothetical protein
VHIFFLCKIFPSFFRCLQHSVLLDEYISYLFAPLGSSLMPPWVILHCLELNQCSPSKPINQSISHGGRQAESGQHHCQPIHSSLANLLHSNPINWRRKVVRSCNSWNSALLHSRWTWVSLPIFLLIECIK